MDSKSLFCACEDVGAILKLHSSNNRPDVASKTEVYV